MVEQPDTAFFDEGSEIEAQLPFRWLHRLQRAQLRGAVRQRFAVGTIGRLVSNRDAPVCLLQGEVPLVGKDYSQFLFVIRPPLTLPTALDHHDAEFAGLSLGQWADAV